MDINIECAIIITKHTRSSLVDNILWNGVIIDRDLTNNEKSELEDAIIWSINLLNRASWSSWADPVIIKSLNINSKSIKMIINIKHITETTISELISWLNIQREVEDINGQTTIKGLDIHPPPDVCPNIIELATLKCISE